MSDRSRSISRKNCKLLNIKSTCGFQKFFFCDEASELLKNRSEQELDRYYKILNCTPESSNVEIKSNYKKLVKDFHPDKIISKGLPEEFIDFAESRFREIQESYEKIQKERNF